MFERSRREKRSRREEKGYYLRGCRGGASFSPLPEPPPHRPPAAQGRYPPPGGSPLAAALKRAVTRSGLSTSHQGAPPHPRLLPGKPRPGAARSRLAAASSVAAAPGLVGDNPPGRLSAPAAPSVRTGRRHRLKHRDPSLPPLPLREDSAALSDRSVRVGWREGAALPASPRAAQLCRRQGDRPGSPRRAPPPATAAPSAQAPLTWGSPADRGSPAPGPPPFPLPGAVLSQDPATAASPQSPQPTAGADRTPRAAPVAPCSRTAPARQHPPPPRRLPAQSRPRETPTAAPARGPPAGTEPCTPQLSPSPGARCHPRPWTPPRGRSHPGSGCEPQRGGPRR